MMEIEEQMQCIEFIKYHFEMMRELGKIGIVLDDINIDKKDKTKTIYTGTVPFKFEILDDNGEKYNHYTAAQKARNIITEYRKKVPDEILHSVPENFTFCYTMRDDTWDENRKTIFVNALIEEERECSNQILEQIKNIN